ncbi:MAG: response regulator, partial [Nitrospirota bacterium]|nr:response regulator [Nitrospirota bacterium]
MPLRVLLADENLAVQKLVELTLQNEGIQLTATDNSLSALDIALKKSPDIILADFNLEGLDIFSFVSKIRQNPRLSDTPIILLINAAETFDPTQLSS